MIAVARKARMVHTLRTWPEPFEKTVEGRKGWEVRNNDRGFREGDFLKLEKFDPLGHAGAGRYLLETLFARIDGVEDFDLIDEKYVDKKPRPRGRFVILSLSILWVWDFCEGEVWAMGYSEHEAAKAVGSCMDQPEDGDGKKVTPKQLNTLQYNYGEPGDESNVASFADRVHELIESGESLHDILAVADY